MARIAPQTDPAPDPVTPPDAPPATEPAPPITPALTSLNLRIPSHVKRQLQMHALDIGKSESTVVASLIATLPTYTVNRTS